MILLRKAYRGHYIEIRPVILHPGHRALSGLALISIDGERLDREFACPRASHLPELLKVATDTIDMGALHQA